MKSLLMYILERLKYRRPKIDKTKIMVFDIDDTLIRASGDDFWVYKKKDGKETKLTTGEYAQDPERYSSSVEYDFRDFRDPEKVYKSIVSGTPLIKNLKFMDQHLRAGWQFCFLTARGLQDVVTKALRKALKFRNKDGKLLKFGSLFREKECAAVNDETRFYMGDTDHEKKANVLKRICSKYKQVIYVDDDPKNLEAALQLALPNLQVVASLEMQQ